MGNVMKNSTALNPTSLNLAYQPNLTSLKLLPWHLILPTLLVAHLTLVRVLRYRAFNALHRKYAAYEKNPYSLSYKQAQEIMQLPLLYDMPFLFGFGTQWALIKSYGIASGTPLLVKTRQLANASTAGKRAEDTAIIIGEFLAGDIDSRRGRLTMAKLNWMHRRYRISDGDYIHTLALFVLEPQRWIEKYEWRPMTRLERAAHLVYWRELGHRMGFGGIPDTLEALEAWKADYETTHLYYAESNRIVAEATLDMFLQRTPRLLHATMRKLFVSFIDEKEVRAALGFPDAPVWARALTVGFFRARGFVIRHFFLPKWRPLDPLAKPGPDGRLYRNASYWIFEPW